MKEVQEYSLEIHLPKLIIIIYLFATLLSFGYCRFIINNNILCSRDALFSLTVFSKEFVSNFQIKVLKGKDK
jgi:hypothetical protein